MHAFIFMQTGKDWGTMLKKISITFAGFVFCKINEPGEASGELQVPYEVGDKKNVVR